MFEYVKLRRHKIHKFEPKIDIQMDVGPYRLETVREISDLVQALRLRYEVFHLEMLGKKGNRGVDVDEFDFLCDHLVIKDKRSEQIVGTYRLNSSLYSNRFYSSSEFCLRKIFENSEVRLELGRACIHKNYRRGQVISLLWRGIGQYMIKSGADILFGCASIHIQNPRQAALLYHYFKLDQRLNSNFQAPPTIDYVMPGLKDWIQQLDRPLSVEELTEAEELIPPLCKAYIRAGAFIGGEPAWDESFACIDFLTILHRENLNEALWKRFSSPDPIVIS